MLRRGGTNHKRGSSLEAMMTKKQKDRYEFSDFDLPDKSYGIGGGIDGTCDVCE